MISYPPLSCSLLRVLPYVTPRSAGRRLDTETWDDAERSYLKRELARLEEMICEEERERRTAVLNL